MAMPLSVHNLMAGGWRTVLSIVGISIAIVLIFMQLGFLGAVTDTAVVLYDKMKFDLMISSPDYYSFRDANSFDRSYLTKIQSVEGVEAVLPFHARLGKWNYADQQVQRGILMMGLGNQGTTLLDPLLEENRDKLLQNQMMLVDRTSRPRFLGEENKQAFGDDQIGLLVEVNGQGRRLAGYFEIGTGLAADGSAVVNESSFVEIFPSYGPNDVSMGLVQLATGTDQAVVKDRIETIIQGRAVNQDSPPVLVLTRQEVENRETLYWMMGTPVGFIFIAGVVVAFIVGSIIVYIVLSSDISKQIGEYATLKAMGYRNSYLSNTVLEQAFVLAVISYLLAFGVSLVLYHVVGEAANLPIVMTVSRQILVFLSSLLMSFLSAMIAMQKLRQADPADLF